MWLCSACLIFGALLLEPVNGETFTCKTIYVWNETHHFTATIRPSSFSREYDDQSHKCIWLKPGNSRIVPDEQWTAKFQITFSRYRNGCANTTVQILYGENGVAKTIDVRPNEMGIDKMMNTFSKEMRFDFIPGIRINENHTNPNYAFTCVKQLKFVGYEVSLHDSAPSQGSEEQGVPVRTTKTTKTPPKSTSHHTESISQNSPPRVHLTASTLNPSKAPTVSKWTPSRAPTVTAWKPERPNIRTAAKSISTSTTKWSPPNWPPSTNTITDELPTPPTPTPNPGGEMETNTPIDMEIQPSPPSSLVHGDRFQWRIISFVFIGLAALLLIVTILLWMALPKRKAIVGTRYAIPRAHIANKT